MLVSLPLSMTIGVIAFAPLGKEYVMQGVMAGLYSAIALGLIAALLGTKSVLISGPRAASALILSSLITQIMLSDDLFFPSGETIPNVILIAYFTILLASFIQLTSGVLKFANIIKYIPYPVIAGFINSSALLIIMGQCWVLFDIRRESSFMGEETFIDFLFRLNEAQPLSMIPGIITIATILLVSSKFRRLPASLSGLVIGSGVFYTMKYFLHGMDIGTTLGSLSNNVNPDTPQEAVSLIPHFPVTDMMQSLMSGGDLMVVLMLVIPAAFSMAALASLDTAVSLSALDDLTYRRTDFNREQLGQGVGNMVSAMFGGLIGAGGMVRTKPGYDAGGRTVFMPVLTSLMMVLALILFGRYIELIPRAVIAGLIMVLGFQIFDRWSLSLLKSCCSRYIFKRVSTLIDIGVVIIVVAVALSFDLIMAVGVGIILSIAIFVSRMSRSIIRNTFRGPAIRARNLWDVHTQTLLEENGRKVAVLELEGPIFFGTAVHLEVEIDDLLRDGVTYVVMDAKRITDIDSTGVLAIQRIQERLRKQGGELAISYVLKERRDTRDAFKGFERRKYSNARHLWNYFKSSGAIDIFGEKIFFSDTDSALAHIEETIITNVKSLNSAHASTVEVPAIIEGLSLSEVKIIRRLSSCHFFKKGETIFEEGDAGNAIYYVSKGRADIVIKLKASGEQKRVLTLMSGTIFGEMAVLDAKPRAASIVATEDTICYRLGISEFEHIKSIYQDIALKLYANICLMFSDRIRSANTMINELEK